MLLDVKSDLTSEYILALKYLDKHNYKALQAKVTETNLKPVPLLNLNSGYITRGQYAPQSGNKAPMHIPNYILDYKMLRLDAKKTNESAFLNKGC
jgi:hypothetical protein